jgi:hypothetical protein
MAPTSVDLVISAAKDTPKIFVEAKLVEREFGGCSLFSDGDCDGRNPSGNFELCYLHVKKKRRYWEILKNHGFLSGPMGIDSMCILAIHYQFFRELLLAIELGGTFVLLFDQRSPVFEVGNQAGERGLVPFLLGMVPGSLKRRVVTVPIQELVAAIKEFDGHAWITDFEDKYGLEMK